MTSDSTLTDIESRRLLVCDVGNSRVKFGLFAATPGVLETPGVAALPVCLHSAAFPLTDRVDWDLIDRWVALEARPPVHRESNARADELPVPPGATSFIAGSNPAAIDRIQQEWAQRTRRPPFEQVIDLCRLIETAVDAPGRVGVDRLLNVVAANVLRAPRQPAVIVDSGTATTVDLVDSDGVFRGGAILPGFELAAKSLHAYTALLPLVTVDELAAEPRAPLGANTRAAIRGGLYWGQVGAVRELVTRQTPGVSKTPGVSPLVLLTGGGAGLLAEQFPTARREPHLSLQGLVLAGIERRAPLFNCKRGISHET